MGLWAKPQSFFDLKPICKIIFRILRVNAEIPVFIKDETFGIPPVCQAVAKIRDPYKCETFDTPSGGTLTLKFRII